MGYDSGLTPTPSDSTSSYSAQQRQEIIDGLKEKLANEQARINERKANFYNTLLPLCDTTQENNRIARQQYYTQSNQSKNIFTQYQKYKEEVSQLKEEQTKKRNAAMAKYSGVEMRAKRDKAGSEASAEFDKDIAQTQGYMTQTFQQYTAQEIQTGLAKQSNTDSRFEEISAFNNAISEGFSLASAEMDLLPIQRQIGFFEGMA